MTTYDAIEKLINENILNGEAMKLVVFEAYRKQHIDGFEYEELHNKALKKQGE